MKNPIFIWIIKLIAVVILVQTLYFKFTGAEESVYIFSTLGVEPYGRIGMSGQQTNAQGTMSLEGTGTGTGSWLVAADGTCLSSSFSGMQNIAVTVAQLPEPIPVTVKIDGTSSLLK